MTKETETTMRETGATFRNGETFDARWDRRTENLTAAAGGDVEKARRWAYTEIVTKRGGDYPIR